MRLSAAGLAVLAASCGRDVYVGDASIQTIQCGTTLYGPAAAPPDVLSNPAPPGQPAPPELPTGQTTADLVRPKGPQVFGPALVLQVAPSCDRGRSVTISPPGRLRVARKADADDGRVVALRVAGGDSVGPATIIVTDGSKLVGRMVIQVTSPAALMGGG